jgi:hypothetical protein
VLILPHHPGEDHVFLPYANLPSTRSINAHKCHQFVAFKRQGEKEEATQACILVRRGTDDEVNNVI